MHHGLMVENTQKMSKILYEKTPHVLGGAAGLVDTNIGRENQY